MSSKNEWTWNNICQRLYEETKTTIKRNASTAFYSKKNQPHLHYDALGVCLGISLLQLRGGMWFPRNKTPGNAALLPMAFASKNLISAENFYSNIERKALGILHDLQ